MGSLVLDGVVIEDEVLLAAGSCRTARQRLQARSLYLGNPPARARRERSRDRRLRLLAAHYVKLKNSYLRTTRLDGPLAAILAAIPARLGFHPEVPSPLFRRRRPAREFAVRISACDVTRLKNRDTRHALREQCDDGIVCGRNARHRRRIRAPARPASPKPRCAERAPCSFAQRVNGVS
jgi:hypothetical protein